MARRSEGRKAKPKDEDGWARSGLELPSERGDPGFANEVCLMTSWRKILQISLALGFLLMENWVHGEFGGRDQRYGISSLSLLPSTAFVKASYTPKDSPFNVFEQGFLKECHTKLHSLATTSAKSDSEGLMILGLSTESISYTSGSCGQYRPVIAAQSNSINGTQLKYARWFDDNGSLRFKAPVSI